MKILLSALVGLLAMTAAPAFACEGQAGQVIYDDNFADDTGGWDLTAPASAVVPPNLVLDLSNKGTLISTQVLTFHAKEADYCVQGVIPKPLPGGNSYYLGLEFWATDYNNFWLAQVSPAGSLSLWQRSNGNWQNFIKVSNLTNIKADETTTLRVLVLNSKISVFVNGQLVKAIRAQEPLAEMRFGAYTQTDTPIDGAASPVKISRYTVTVGQ